MKSKACLILFVLTVVLTDDAEAWGIRLPRIQLPRIQLPRIRLPRLPPVPCRTGCPKVCPVVVGGVVSPPVGEPGCKIGCPNVCKRRVSDTEFVTKGINYKLVPMSRNFSHYDLNGNKLISPEEFAKAENLPLEEVSETFKYADIDGDNMLDEDEFAAGPYVFKNETSAGNTGTNQEDTGRQPVKEGNTQP